MQAAVVVILEENWQYELLVLNAKCRREKKKQQTKNNPLRDLILALASIQGNDLLLESIFLHTSSSGS